jgi:hypothetical protein
VRRKKREESLNDFKKIMWTFIKILRHQKKQKMVDWTLTSLFAGSSVMIGLSIVWALMGLAGFIYSLVCMGKTPSVARAVIGIVMAVLFGPLYWVYWFFDKDYCRGAHKTL